MDSKSAFIRFHAPGASLDRIQMSHRADGRIIPEIQGDEVIFTISDFSALQAKSFRESFLEYAFVLHELLPEDSSLIAVGPDRIDGRAMMAWLGLLPSQVNDLGVDLFRRESNSPATIAHALARLRRDGLISTIGDELRQHLTLTADANTINGQIARGLAGRLLKEGEVFTSDFDGVGLASAALVGEGYFSHVRFSLIDGEQNLVTLRSDGQKAHFSGNIEDIALGDIELSQIAEMNDMAREILTEEHRRFEATLADWVRPECVEREARPVLLLGEWDGNPVWIWRDEDGEPDISGAPFCFPAGMEDPVILASVFGEGEVLRLALEVLEDRRSA